MMKHSQLWWWILLPLGLSLGTIMVSMTQSILVPHLWFYLICLVIFLAFTIGNFFVGIQTSSKKNRSLFGSAVLAGMTFKMLASILAVVIYVKLYQNISKWFILPFFLMYLYFTVYEAYGLIKIGKSSK